MGYCFMHIEKIKSMGALASKYNHNYRTVEVSNAIKEKEHQNEELVALPVINGKKADYVEAFKERFKTLPYYKNHNIRSNAVPAFEVLTTFSRNEEIDLESWKKKNVEWLKKTFDVAPDNVSNVISVVYHGDEVGNVHCHAIVIPIDEKGHLNARRFVENSRALSNMQTSYAKDMESFGLERGVEGSSATHEDIRKYYRDLNYAIKNVPDPYERESAVAYKNRVMEELGTARAANLKSIKDAQVKGRREIDIEKNASMNVIKREFESKEREIKELVQKAEDEIKLIRNDKEELEEELELIQYNVNHLNEVYEEKKKELDSIVEQIDDIQSAVTFYNNFMYGLERLKRDEPEKAESQMKLLEHMNKYRQERDMDSYDIDDLSLSQNDIEQTD